MKILVLLLTIPFLLMTLKALKHTFKTKEQYTKEIKEALNNPNNLKNFTKEQLKGLTMIMVTLYYLYYITFLILTGTFIAQTWAIVLVTILIVLYIRGYFKTLKMIEDEKVEKLTLSGKVIPFINIIYIPYFLILYLGL